jgi:hypothetical protein
MAEKIREKFGDELAEKYEELASMHGDGLRVWASKRVGLFAIAMHDNAGVEYDRLVDALTNAKNEEGKAVALRTFAKTFVAYPDKREASRIFASFPAFATRVAASAQELCEGDFDDLEKL